VADAYQETTGIDVGVVMNAPPLAAQRRHEAQKPHVILYQGALNAGRGLEAMIDAMPKLDLQLHIIGEGDLSAELRLRAIQLGVANKVKFLGWLPPEALPEHTAAAWLGLNVSENLGKSYYYSLNNKFFDYIHSGLPSLINPFPEYLRMLEKWKVGICAESNPESLVDAIRYLQGNPEIYRDMELACLEAAQELNWENAEKKLLHWYA
jgi:glycosyltransferase involved in cell wall biosynthesis